MTDPDPDRDVGPDPDTDPDAELETQPDPDTDPDAELEAQPDPDTDPDAELDEDHVYLGDVEDLDEDDDGAGELGSGAGVNRAPICGFCGVTALPADPSNVIDTAFVCDNEDCEAFRDVIG